MRNALIVIIAFSIALFAGAARAADPEVEALRAEIRALKAQLKKVEERLENVTSQTTRAEVTAVDAQVEARKATSSSLKISRLLETGATERGGFLSDLEKRLKIYGAVELEASYEKIRVKDGEDTSNSDITLATAELFIEAEINKYTRALIHFLWEEDDTEPVDLDEAFIVVGDTEDMPFYFLGGRIYPAIAQFETYMVSDPITQNVFETQQTAAEIGYNGLWFGLGAGLYNGAVSESSDDPDELVNSWWVRASLSPPEGTLGELNLGLAAAYTNNIAGSGFLEENVTDSRLQDLVGGWSVSFKAEYLWLALVGEYIRAQEFEPGELTFAPAEARPEPWALNLELALMPIEDWTFALRYEASGDLYNQEPERQYGLAASWEFLPDTTISLEYLRGDYDNDDTRDLVTSQLAVAF